MRFNLSDWGVRNGALTLFLILLLAAAGAFSYLRLGRAEDPGFTLKLMVVSAQWPGATAEEMQAQVADRIESKLQDLPHLDYVQTFTRPGSAITTVVLQDTTPPKEVQGLWYQVRKKVGDIQRNLPAGVQGPFFDDEYSDVYAVVIALTGADNAELVRQAERIRLRFLALPGAGKVAIFGEEAQRVFVDVSHARLATLAVPPTAILDALARHNAIAPAGVAETASSRIYLRTDAGYDGLAAIRAVPVESGGRTLRLGDLASVSRGLADPPSSSIRHEGKPAVLVGIAKRPGVDVLALGRDVQAELARLRAELPAGLELAEIADQPGVVQESVSEFLLKFAVALAVVMVVSFLSLGFRAGIIVALSVPLTLAIVFLVMLAWGMELERITLGALILSLGLLVDDAIIAIEAMAVKLDQGWDRVRAATFAWSSTAFPMLFGTLVTVAGFLPVGFAASTAGEYAGGIFWVVGVALVASWLVAVLFIPYLGVRLLPVPKPGAVHHDSYDSRTYRALRRLVGWCVDHRAVVLLATVGVLGIGFAGMGATRKQFFPTSARLELLVDINLRQGAGLPATRAAAEAVEATLKGDPDARTYTTYLGAGAPRFFLALNPDLPNESFAKVVIQTTDLAARERLLGKLRALAQDGAVPEARIRVSRLEFGPPVGFPVQFRIHGPDADTLRRTAEDVATALRATPGTRDIQFSWSERAPGMRIALDQERLAQLGLSPSRRRAIAAGAAVRHHRDAVARGQPPGRRRRPRPGRRTPLARLARRPHHLHPRRRRRPLPARPAGAGDGGAHPLAPQPRDGPDRPRRHRRRPAGPGRHRRRRAAHRRPARPPARRSAHRHRRRDRGKRQGQCRALRPVPHHGRRHAAAADVAAPPFRPHRAGARHRAARHPRRRGGAAGDGHALRLRRAARRHRPGRDDHAQHRHPGGPGAAGPGSRRRPAPRHRREHGAARATGGADGAGRGAGLRAADALGLLGADGRRHDRWAGAGHRSPRCWWCRRSMRLALRRQHACCRTGWPSRRSKVGEKVFSPRPSSIFVSPPSLRGRSRRRGPRPPASR